MRDRIAWAIATAVLWLIATPRYYRFIRAVNLLGIDEFERRFNELQKERKDG